jgi:hypothetical protein
MLRIPLLALATLTLAASITNAADTQPAPQKLLQLIDHLDPATPPKPADEKDLTNYLLVYFKDETHSLYFATSPDSYSFTDVNNARPVLLGKDVAVQKGIRDPHITRGPDGAFYMALTDLHIFAQREGLRSTQWERPGNLYDWGNNRDLILMKSTDLLHWTHHQVFIHDLFPTFGDIGCAWAPETIFDPTQNALMVYFTTRIAHGPNFLVYSYADKDFTTLTTEPKQLFTYPNPKINTIDGDITKVGNQYHLFYVAHDRPGGLRQAVSTTINAGYVFNPQKIDPEKVACEAPTLFHRHNTDTYILMYDVFGAHPNNMGFSETTDFQTFKNLGRFNDKDSPMKSTNFTGPKHGAVMPITPEEAQRLHDYFNQ